MPKVLRRKVPAPQTVFPWPQQRHSRTMLVLQGCVQSTATPATNIAAARVLDSLGISLIEAPAAGCCGALSMHLGARAEALEAMRRNIDAWWPYIEAGAEAIVMTASGCGVMVKDYAHALQQDPVYAAKAARVSELTRDLSEVIQLYQQQLPRTRTKVRVAYHPPCTLQHGQQLSGVVEAILVHCGYHLTQVPQAQRCCGSAGTYSLLQPGLSQTLLGKKLADLQSDAPERIVTANIGCQLHLASGTALPVQHWIELLAAEIAPD